MVCIQKRKYLISKQNMLPGFVCLLHPTVSVVVYLVLKYMDGWTYDKQLQINTKFILNSTIELLNKTTNKRISLTPY